MGDFLQRSGLKLSLARPRFLGAECRLGYYLVALSVVVRDMHCCR